MTTNEEAVTPGKATAPNDQMSTNDTASVLRPMSDLQKEILAKRGISVEQAVKFGVRSIATTDELPEGCPTYWNEANGYLPGLLFPWVAEDGRTEYQIRPDNPPVDKDGRPVKYASRSKEDGYSPVLWLAKRGYSDGPRLLVEGTCQTLAAAIHAPEDTWVYGMVGCRGWMSEGTPVVGLAAFEGHKVVVALDADMWTNVGVWEAGEVLQRALRAEGVESVKFLKLAAGKKTGLDDVLGTRTEGHREYLYRLIRDAELEKFPKSRRPKKKAEDGGDGSSWFGENGGLLAEDLAEAIVAKYPAALTAEGIIAMYTSGVYEIQDWAVSAAVQQLMGNDFRREYRGTAEELVRNMLAMARKYLPARTAEPLLNCTNGMLDLRTGELLPHDPKHMSSTQIPIPWEPDATCPRYEAWLEEVIPDQINDLEESVSLMLDGSRTPTKAVFLFGPARSGKSTMLRLLRAVAGERNLSAVSLEQLSENRFMAANIYGKMLNCSADISAKHLADISTFKMMTGDDVIEADRKHGKQFTFTNRALFAFSANNPPTVGEASAAYVERIRPFKFCKSFKGNEKPEIEDAMMRELPGILVRWVKAWQRRTERGRPLETLASVREEFAAKSNRVAQFVTECCVVTHTIEGARLDSPDASSLDTITAAFKVWAEADNGHAMGSRTLKTQLEAVDGVCGVRMGKDRKRGYNVRVLSERERADLSEQRGHDAGTNGHEAGREAGEPARSVSAGGSTAGEGRGHDGHEALTAPSSEETKNQKVSSPGAASSAGFVPVLPVAGSETASTCGNSAGTNGHEQPSFVPDPKASILALAQPVPEEARTCPDCGSLKELVPPARFWYACPACHPATFTRGGAR